MIVRYAALWTTMARIRCIAPELFRSDLRQRLFRALQELLDIFDINLRRRIVVMPHHLLHPCRICINAKCNGRGRVPVTMHYYLLFLRQQREVSP